MEKIIDYVILGFLQGIIEWLPISSQGNLIFYLSNFLNISPILSLNYSILLHTGTLLASIFYFRKDICTLLSFNNIRLFFRENIRILRRKEEAGKEDIFFLRFLAISLIVTIFISSPVYFFMKQNITFVSVSVINLIIGFFLILTGLLIFVSKKIIPQNPSFTLKNSILLGIFQGFSIIPGLSRSGLTTSLLLFRGFSPEKSFRISFLLSIPTILIGQIGLLIFNGIFFSSYILISIITSFFVGYFTIDFLIKFSKRINFCLLKNISSRQ